MLACSEPVTFEEAIASDHAAQWRAAMEEDSSVIATQAGSWRSCLPPTHASAVPVKWVSKLKPDAASQVERYYFLRRASSSGVDFNEVFVPVTKYASLLALLALAAYGGGAAQ
jgi:hypothetical protein